MPVKTAQIKENETQTAAMLSLDVQSRFDVRCIFAPFPVRRFRPPYLNGEVRYQISTVLRSTPEGLGTARLGTM
jgi:hypothetical protein